MTDINSHAVNLSYALFKRVKHTCQGTLNGLWKPRLCGFSSFGRAPPSQGGCSEFEPRNPLQIKG